jgi:hypothetical protein
MSSSVHFIHTLCRRSLGTGMGWYAPLELENSEQGVCFAAPVDDKRRLFGSYRVEFVRLARLAAEGGPGAADAEVVDRDAIRFSIQGEAFTLVARRVFGRYRALPYRGRLSHADFRLRLVEFEEAQEGVFDALLESNGIVVMGCDPHSHYIRG